MKIDELISTLDVVADALPDDIDPQHPERLKMIRDLLHFFLFTRKRQKRRHLDMCQSATALILQ